MTLVSKIRGDFCAYSIESEPMDERSVIFKFLLPISLARQKGYSDRSFSLFVH